MKEDKIIKEKAHEVVLECELFRQGHGIKQERTNVREMVECQMEHKDKWQKTN